MKRVTATRCNRGLKSRHERLRVRGMLTVQEAAERLAVSEETVRAWRKAGLLRGHAYGDGTYCLYEIPENPPTKQPGRWLTRRPPIPEPSLSQNSEV